MNDLVAFLNARLGEDERVARAAAADGDGWKLRDHESDYWLITDASGEVVVYDEGSPTEPQAEHIARHDPARVLAEVEAKRAILALHGTNTQEPYAAKVPGGMFYPPDPYYCGCQAEDGLIYGHEPCDTKRLLAAPYADHPDFDPNWGI